MNVITLTTTLCRDSQSQVFLREAKITRNNNGTIGEIHRPFCSRRVGRDTRTTSDCQRWQRPDDVDEKRLTRTPRHAGPSFHTPFPILESDSDSSISKGRRQKTDVFKEIPSNIEVQREGIRGEGACLQLTFDGNVLVVGEGQAFPDFAKTLKKHRKKMRRDALKLTFDGNNVMSVREGQAFSDFASTLKQKLWKDGKTPRGHSPRCGLFGSVMHAQYQGISIHVMS